MGFSHEEQMTPEQMQWSIVQLADSLTNLYAIVDHINKNHMVVADRVVLIEKRLARLERDNDLKILLN